MTMRALIWTALAAAFCIAAPLTATQAHAANKTMTMEETKAKENSTAERIRAKLNDLDKHMKAAESESKNATKDLWADVKAKADKAWEKLGELEEKGSDMGAEAWEKMKNGAEKAADAAVAAYEAAKKELKE